MPNLSPREKQVVGHLARGLSLAEIGVELELKSTTMKTYAEKIRLKFGVGKATEIPFAFYLAGGDPFLL